MLLVSKPVEFAHHGNGRRLRATPAGAVRTSNFEDMSRCKSLTVRLHPHTGYNERMIAAVLCPRCTQSLPQAAGFCRRCGMPMVRTPLVAPVRSSGRNSSGGRVWLVVVLAGMGVGGLTVFSRQSSPDRPWHSSRSEPATPAVPTAVPEQPRLEPAVRIEPDGRVVVVQPTPRPQGDRNHRDWDRK